MNITKTFSLSSLVGLTAVALAVVGADVADAGIEATPHNLSTTGTGDNHLDATAEAGTAGATEICVFCHTPHGAAATAAAPLWNKTMNAPGDYTPYSSTTMDSTVDFQAGTVSMACLSCHDGTQAMDVMLNAPGSGVNNDGAADPRWVVDDGAGGTRNLTWTGSSTITGIANLGADLSNDHPVSMAYAGAWGATAALDPGMNAAVANGSRYEVAVTDGTRLILYNRDVDTVTTPFVECATCHDPHVENTTFLRTENTNSQICTACHAK